MFWKIKEKFKEKSILIHFDYEKSAIINTDALECAIKACLQQLDDQEWKRLIACYMWKLMLMKQWYNVHNQEMLAIVETVTECSTSSSRFDLEL